MSEQIAWIRCSLSVELLQAVWTPLLSTLGDLDTILAGLWVLASALGIVGAPRRQLGRPWSLIVLCVAVYHESSQWHPLCECLITKNMLVHFYSDDLPHSSIISNRYIFYILLIPLTISLFDNATLGVQMIPPSPRAGDKGGPGEFATRGIPRVICWWGSRRVASSLPNSLVPLTRDYFGSFILGFFCIFLFIWHRFPGWPLFINFICPLYKLKYRIEIYSLYILMCSLIC